MEKAFTKISFRATILLTAKMKKNLKNARKNLEKKKINVYYYFYLCSKNLKKKRRI